MLRAAIVAAAVAASLGLVATRAWAQSAAPAGDAKTAGEAASPGISLELNRLEPADKACRTYLLLKNASGESYGSLKLDLFVLDRGGVVAKRLAVEAGPLASRKTQIKTFDFADLACERIGTMLVNGVLACQVGGASRDDCIDRIALTSRDPSVALIK